MIFPHPNTRRRPNDDRFLIVVIAPNQQLLVVAGLDFNVSPPTLYLILSVETSAAGDEDTAVTFAGAVAWAAGLGLNWAAGNGDGVAAARERGNCDCGGLR